MSRLLCLRDGKTRKLLNVAFTEEGLKYTTDDKGRYVYFTNPKMKIENNKVILTGYKSPDIRIIPYEPFEIDKDRLIKGIKAKSPQLSDIKVNKIATKIADEFNKAEDNGKLMAKAKLYEVEG